MAGRRAWLAGSLPGDTLVEAMTRALDEIGPYLLALPSGETSRPLGVVNIAQDLAKSSLFRVVKEGDFTDYDHLTHLSPIGDLRDLDLGYYDLYRTESTIARQLIKDYGLALSFQVGIPSPFTLGMSVLGPGRSMRHAKHFYAATARDIMLIHTSDETTIFSIECPRETCAAISAPTLGRTIIMRRLVKKITELIGMCPLGARFAIHPCFGDLHHRAKCSLPRLGLLVDFINELVRQWPNGYTLVYVHLPFAEGNLPPVTATGWYTPLTRLALPAGVRVVAGLCHEAVTTEELIPLVRLLDTLCRQTVAVGASCGLALRGDRDMSAAQRILRQQRELCEC